MYPERLYSYKRQDDFISNIQCKIYRRFKIRYKLDNNKLNDQQISEFVSPDFEKDLDGKLLFTISHNISTLSEVNDLKIKILNESLKHLKLNYNQKVKVEEQDYEIADNIGGYALNTINVLNEIGINNEDKVFFHKSESKNYSFKINVIHKPEQINFSHCNLVIQIFESGRHITKKPYRAAIKAAKKYVRKLVIINHDIILKPKF